MTRAATARNHISIRGLFLVAGIAAFALASFAARPTADKDSDPRYVFERAVRMRTQLEGYLPRDRSLANYKDTITAYHKVYLLSPQAEEVTPSLIAEAELNREMGRQFDAKYFQTAIDTYNFLLKEYPRSQYRPQALFAIAEIQREDLDQPDAALASYKEYLKRFPKSDKAADAREAISELTNVGQPEPAPKQAKANPIPPRDSKPAEVRTAEPVSDFPALKGDAVEPRESDKRMPYVTGVKAWNSDGHTRVVVTLNDTVKFDAMHVASPERLYFDLHRAQVDPKADKSPKVDPGLLKSVHFGQNKPTVVRVVLDVGGALNYSTQFLSNPYRLVIDVRSEEAAREAAAPRVDDSKSAAKAAESVRANSHSATPPPPGNSAADLASRPAIPKSKVKADQIAAMKPAPAPEPKPNRDGQRSLTRALGLKISRIVIDRGHGGHDTGTIGP